MARFVLTAVFVALFSVAAFAGPPSLVIVERHFEAIVITHGLGQTETVAALRPDFTKNYQANVEQLHTIFSKLYAEGYTLQNSTSISTPYIATYTFVKP